MIKIIVYKYINKALLIDQKENTYNSMSIIKKMPNIDWITLMFKSLGSLGSILCLSWLYLFDEKYSKFIWLNIINLK